MVRKFMRIATWVYDKLGYNSLSFVAKNHDDIKKTEMWSITFHDDVDIVLLLEAVVHIIYENPHLVKKFVQDNIDILEDKSNG